MGFIPFCSFVAHGFLLLLLGTILRAQEEGDVILIGPTDYQGTVGVFHNGQWGSICDDSWNREDADVVCRQLGFERSDRVWYRAHYGEAPGPIWLDQIRCGRTDTSILDCRSDGWGIHDCRKREDAGVDCHRKMPIKPSTLPIALSCPDSVQGGSCSACPKKTHPAPNDCSQQVAVEGIVFAYYGDKWLPISGEGWDIEEAHVACGELGYPLALGIPSLDELWLNWDGQLLKACKEGSAELDEPTFGYGSGLCTSAEVTENDDYRNLLYKTLFTKVQCIGNEWNINRCYYSDIGPFEQSTINVATVRCGFKPHSSCTSHPLHEEIYRTRGAAVPWEGRVDVRVDGKWGTVCDRDWGLEEANIVCRALGYGTAKLANYRAQFGRGVGPIHYSRLRCNGSEKTLKDCADKQTGYLAEQCGHIGDAGVTCNAPELCADPERKKHARLLELPQEFNPRYNDHYVQVRGSDGWGLLCTSSLKIAAANVICRSERELFAFRVRSGKALTYSGPRYKAVIQCKGDEASIEDCGRQFVLTTSCPDEKYAVVDCSRGLPDLVPDLETLARSLFFHPYIDRTPMYHLQCAKEEDCLSSSADNAGINDLRHLLRFDSLTMNWGTTDFLPDRNRNEWQFHDCHNHFHSFEAFIHYDLLHSVTDKKVAEGHKASFCLEDSLCDSGGRPRYRCSSGHQGISANCGDLYGRYLDCQWIDITDVPLGTYILRLHVNPDNLVQESDYNNNELRCIFTIVPEFRLTDISCSLSEL